MLSLLPDPNATLKFESRPTQSTPTSANQRLTFGAIAVASVSILGLVIVIGVIVGYFAWGNRGAKVSKPLADPSLTAANSGDSNPVKPAKEEVAKELESLNDQITSALVNSDVDTLDRLLADDYRFGNDLGLRLTKSELLRMLRTGAIRYEYVTSVNSNVEVAPSLTRAVMTARAQAKGIFQGSPFSNSYSYKNDYEKRARGWQLVNGFAWYR